MLKKLRKQFILSSIIPIFLVIVLAFCALTIITYDYEKSESISALSAAVSGGISSAFFPDMKTFDDFPKESMDKPEEGLQNTERLSSIALIVLVDNDSKIAIWESSTNYSFDEEDVNTLVSCVFDNSKGEEKETGIVSDYNYRYMKISTPNGYKIAFCDRSPEIKMTLFMLRTFGFVGLAIMALMFLIADYLAKKSIAPVEKSWEDQKRFVADASHELKTPLTVILANMDIMQANKETTVWEQNKWIENTKSEANRMTELVNDMLFLARSDAQIDQAYNFQEVNFSHVAEDCVLSFESLAFERGLNLTSNIPLDIFVLADETRIKQVMMILVDNALKYVSDKGDIFVTAEANQKQVKFSVANTGNPIPEEKRAHIFERFYRVDDSRAREKGGFGLGLSIAQNIIDAHSGTLSLEYSNEKGTCFSFTLPVKQGKKK